MRILGAFVQGGHSGEWLCFHCEHGLVGHDRNGDLLKGLSLLTANIASLLRIITKDPCCGLQWTCAVFES